MIARLNSGRDNTGVGGGGNPIDSAFTAMADLLVEAIPTSKRSKEAFQFYRSGMQAQSDGKYAEALSNYFQVGFSQERRSSGFVWAHLSVGAF